MLRLLYRFTKQVKHNGRVYKAGSSEYFHTKSLRSFRAVHGQDVVAGPYAGETTLAGGKGHQFMDKNKSLSAGIIDPNDKKSVTVQKSTPERTDLTEEELEAIEKENAAADEKRAAEENAEAELRIQAIVDEGIRNREVEEAKAEAIRISEEAEFQKLKDREDEDAKAKALEPVEPDEQTRGNNGQFKKGKGKN